MLKKKFSLVTALIMMITLFVGQMPAWAKVNFVADGYEIMESAYGNGTYVAMAKNSSDYASAKIYASVNGIKWTESFSATNVKNSAAAKSRQELVYWNAENIFVAALGGDIYTSKDGMEWIVNENLRTNANSIIEAKDNMLVIAGGNKVKVATNLETVSETVECFGSSNYYATLIAIESESKVYINSTWTRGTIEKKDGVWTRTSNPYEAAAQNVIDAKRIGEQNKWLTLINNSPALSVIVSGGDYSPKQFKPKLADGENTAVISSVGSDSVNLFFGTETGKLYGISSSANLVAAEDSEADIWIEITPDNGTSPITEEVTDINNIGNDRFIVTTETGIYEMNKNGEGYTYHDMLSYQNIEEVTITEAIPFVHNNIQILGGVYSSELEKYIVYGNDQNEHMSGDHKIPGKAHIYSSADGIHWTEDEFSMPNGNRPPAFTTQSKNTAVYWPEQNSFVLGGLNRWGGYAMGIVMSDTMSKWEYKNIKIGNEGDIALIGTNLYSTNYSARTAVDKHANLSGNAEKITYSNSPVSYDLNNMAVSSDEKYLILSHETGRTYLYDLTTPTEPKEIKNVSPGMRDIHWNDTLKTFVMVQNNTNKNTVMMIDPAGTIVKAETPSKGNLTAVHTNDSNYITGDNLGKLYSTNANLSAASKFTEIQPLGEANKLPVTNIFKGADNKYFVTVSDGTDSDLLIVNADGSAYQKVSEMLQPTSVKAGDALNISVKTGNYTESDKTITMIAAIYDAEGTKLLQVNSEEKTMTLNTDENLTMSIVAGENVTDDAKVKVFLWDSVNGMVPVAGEAKSFF